MFAYLEKFKKKFLYNKNNFWNRKLTLKAKNSPIWGSWRYVNSQNIAISLKPIHFCDEIKLILYQKVRNSLTQLTLVMYTMTLLICMCCACALTKKKHKYATVFIQTFLKVEAGHYIWIKGILTISLISF